jgi:hypothetical protein
MFGGYYYFSDSRAQLGPHFTANAVAWDRSIGNNRGYEGVGVTVKDIQSEGVQCNLQSFSV